MNKQLGVSKKIDSLGRIVIPKEMRLLFKLEDKVELIVTERGILLKKPDYILVKKQ